MNEKVGSIAAFTLAILVVVVVVNKHIFEEIIDDIRGVTSSRRPAPGPARSGGIIGGGGGGGGGSTASGGGGGGGGTSSSGGGGGGGGQRVSETVSWSEMQKIKQDFNDHTEARREMEKGRSEDRSSNKSSKGSGVTRDFGEAASGGGGERRSDQQRLEDLQKRPVHNDGPAGARPAPQGPQQHASANPNQATGAAGGGGWRENGQPGTPDIWVGAEDENPNSSASQQGNVAAAPAANPTKLPTTPDVQPNPGPRIVQLNRQQSPGLLLLRCDQSPSGHVWLARVDSETLHWPVGDELAPGLVDALGDHDSRPRGMSFVSHGCSNLVVGLVRRTLSDLCGNELIGFPIHDMIRQSAIPLCGL